MGASRGASPHPWYKNFSRELFFKRKMQSTLREKYTRSFSAPESTASIEARIVFESALERELSQQHLQQEQSKQESVLEASSNASVTCKELGQELVVVSTQIGKKDGKIQEIITRIIMAVIEQNNVDQISEPFFEAIESMVKRRMNVDTFINVMVFCITLVRRYRAASLSSWQDKAVWVTEQVYELMVSAYQRYHIDDWIQEQGGWTGVLKLVRKKYQTFSDYAIGERGLTRRNAVAAGAIVLISAVGFAVWYNW